MAKTIKLKIGTERHRLVIDEKDASCYRCSLNSVCNEIRAMKPLCSVLMLEAGIDSDKLENGHFELE